MPEYQFGRLFDHVHLRVADLVASRRFYKAVLGLLGREPSRSGTRRRLPRTAATTAPRTCAYHPGYYAPYVLDPDGNNVEAVFHGPTERSALSVVGRPR